MDKNKKSVWSLVQHKNKNKITKASGNSLEEFLDDIVIPKQHNDSSYVIEVGELDDESGLSSRKGTIKGSRVQTTKASGANAILSMDSSTLKIKNQNLAIELTSRNNPSLILAEARKELQSMRQSEIPLGHISTLSDAGHHNKI